MMPLTIQISWRSHRSRMSFEDIVAPLRGKPIDYPATQVKEIVSAIHNKVHQVSFKEGHHPDPPSYYQLQTMSPDELSKFYHYDVESVFNLHSDVKYFSLDQAHHAASVKEISKRKLVHCVNPQAQDPVPAATGVPEVGDIFMATSHGDEVHSSGSTTNVHRNLVDFMNSPHVRQNKGFLMLRRVVQVVDRNNARNTRILEGKDASIVNGEDDICRTIHTEDIHPFDLFHNFKINTSLDRKTQEIYYPSTEKRAPREDAELDQYVISVDSPLHACTDPYFSTAGTLYTAFNDEIAGTAGYGTLKYLYCTGLVPTIVGGCRPTELCTVYTLTAPGSFNYNYNPNTRAAVQSVIDFADYGVSGLTCTNCYAYMGVRCNEISCYIVLYSMSKQEITVWLVL